MSNADKKPRGIKPVIKIELIDDKKRLRLILLVVFLLIGMVALFYGLTTALNTDPGWKIVEVESSDLNCSGDFVLNYYLGDAGVSATVEYKQLSAVYTEATVKGFWLFHESVLTDKLNNVAYLNTHPNEIVTVDPVLYQAFALIQQNEIRSLYLGPVYIEYDRIFRSESEGEAKSFDPAQNAEQAAYIQEIAAFANDPEQINLELLGNNQVRLKVSEEYLAYIQENELTDLLNFGWMKNAFIADYLAEVLLDAGFTKGFLVSYDGFTRNLDNREILYNFNLFDREGNDIYMPALMEYNKPISIVFLRNYPMSDQDQRHYYRFSNGRIVTSCIDPQDGMSKSAVDNVVSYSYQAGCAEILMQLAPVYLQDTFHADALHGLADAEIYSVWFADTVLSYNDRNMKLQMQSAEKSPYSAAYADK